MCCQITKLEQRRNFCMKYHWSHSFRRPKFAVGFFSAANLWGLPCTSRARALLFGVRAGDGGGALRLALHFQVLMEGESDCHWFEGSFVSATACTLKQRARASARFFAHFSSVTERLPWVGTPTICCRRFEMPATIMHLACIRITFCNGLDGAQPHLSIMPTFTPCTCHPAAVSNAYWA